MSLKTSINLFALANAIIAIRKGVMPDTGAQLEVFAEESEHITLETPDVPSGDTVATIGATQTYFTGI